MTVAAEAVGFAARPVWRDLLVLLKLRIDSLVVCVALAAAVAAGTTSTRTLLVLAVSCLLAAAGASSLNHYVDRDLDARMSRTRRRPLPAGRLRPAVALWLGVVLLAVSQAAAWPLGFLPAVYLLLGALTYALVYSAWLKPRTPYSIVVGGAAGSFAVLAGWQTAASTSSPAAVLLAAVLLLWTPSHFWSLAIVLESDYRAARLPMLSALVGARKTADAVALNTAGLVACSLALAAYVGWPYAVVAVPAGAAYLACTLHLRRQPDHARAWRAFKLSGLYLLCLLAGLCLSVAG